MVIFLLCLLHIVMENCYGVYKSEHCYTRINAVSNILCDDGFMLSLDNTSAVVCGKVCASHPSCVSFIFSNNGDCHLHNNVLFDTKHCQKSPDSSYYVSEDVLQETTTEIMTLFEESTASVLICNSGWLKLGNGCYMFTPDGTKYWTDAKTFCNSIGGYLAMIETSEENELLKSHVATIYPSYDFWIGGSDLTIEGVFTWENSGATVNLPNSTLFHGWQPNQPDNNNENQHCMMLAHYFNFNWNDAKCDYPRNFVCEKN